MIRRVSLYFGLLVFGLGAVAVFVPGLNLFSRTALLLVVGVIAVLRALDLANGARKHPRERAETPDPERRRGLPAPGTGLDERLAAASRTAPGIGQVRERIRERVRRLAIDVVRRERGIDEATAEDRIDEGTWTEDGVAAAFLAPRGKVLSADTSVAARDAARVFGQAVDHTVVVLSRIAGLSVPEYTEPPEPSPPADLDRAESGPTTRETGHWAGVGAVLLAPVGVGLVTATPSLVVAGLGAVAFGTYARSRPFSPEDGVSVAVERDISVEEPDPGDHIRVDVTVRNDGTAFLPDVRVVDGVPPGLAVDAGSPRCAAALKPGEETTFSYSMEARRGVHDFEPATVIARDLTGSVEREQSVAAATSPTLTCRPRYVPLPEVPLSPEAPGFAGRLPMDQSGAGIEFYGVREYRPGDPINQVDWHRVARTGELSTVEFREEREATVVVLVDVRAEAYRAPAEGADSSVDRGVEAAGRLLVSLHDRGFRVGLAALGPAQCWIPPSYGEGHLAKIREALATDDAFQPAPPTGDFDPVHTQRRVRQQLSAEAQLVFCTPLVDGVSKLTALRLHAYGYPVTVVSPDVTADTTTGSRLVRLERDVRSSELRRRGVEVVDWKRDEPLHAAVARFGRQRR